MNLARSMKKVYYSLKESDIIPASVLLFLEVSANWDKVDSWMKDLLFPAQLKGNIVTMDYYSPLGRMKLLYNKKDVLEEIRRLLPFVEDVRLGKARTKVRNAGDFAAQKDNETGLLTPSDEHVCTDGIKDKELAELFEKYVRIRRSWQEWKRA